MSIPRGKFITLEGGEGAGKSTCLRHIEAYLKARGVAVTMTREPGGTPLGEKVREILLASDAVDDQAELLLLFAARAQHIREVIEPALTAGRWVVSDRFTDASYAYQGGGRGLDFAVIGQLEGWVQGALRPDLTLLLDLPVELGLERAGARGEPADRFEQEQVAFFRRVRSAYLQRAAADSARIRIVDASQSLADVQDAISKRLDRFMGP